MWELARRAQEDQSTLRWGWWESTINLSRRWFGFATMPTYVNFLALKLASTRPFEPQSPPAENDVTLAHNLDVLMSIRGGTFRNLGNEWTSVDIEGEFKPIVRAVLDEDARRRRQILTQTPLDKGRLERFRRALRDSLGVGSTPRLARILMDGATAGKARKVRQSALVDKWWFVESEVYGEPEELAASLARAMIDQEDEEIISTIVKATSLVEVRAESINEYLPDWLTSDHGVIVTNSWDAYYALIPHDQFELLTGDNLLETASGIPVLRLYDDKSPFAAAFLTPRGIRCKLSSPTGAGQIPSGFAIEDTMLVGVREPTESDLMASATDSGTSQNEYRAQALIEASEELTVEVNDSSYVKMWRLLPEDG